MTDHPSSQAQAKVALPPLPDMVAIADGSFNCNAPLGTPLYTADQLHAAIAQDRAARAQAEPVASERERRLAFHRYLQSRGIPSDLFQQDDAGTYEFAAVEHDWQVWSAARAQGAGEAVLWQSRFFDDANRPGGWGEWEEVKPRNVHTDTVADRVAEIQAYIDRGYKYELRALYAAPTTPQATPPAQGDQPTPAGYVLGPREPTEDMLFAAEQSKPRGYRDLYAAMISAAPQVAHPQPLAASEAEPEPFGQVAVYPSKHPNQVTRYEFYPWPQSPYLDNASECMVVYRKEPQ